MRNFSEALGFLDLLSDELARKQKELIQVKKLVNLNPGDRINREEKIEAAIKQKESERIQVLRELVTYPPRYLPYGDLLNQFSTESNLEKSVFIMTKYPDGKDAAKDAALQRVIDCVKAAVTSSGFHPRLANGRKYHANLWENVEVYLLGCARGIAIVEDRFNPKLNPNVAMEWGWMRAAGKPVLYLVEKDVTVFPADVDGLIKDRFEWDNPEPDIRSAIFTELTGAPPPAAAAAG